MSQPEAKLSQDTSIAISSDQDSSSSTVQRKAAMIEGTTGQADGMSSQGAAKFFSTQSSLVEGKKIGHRRVDEQTGQVTYKNKTTTELMTAIQLGIGQSVGSLTSKPERDVLMQDFSVVEQISFPENGSNLTPAHRVGDFKFKTYAPIAFRYFRELFGIRTDDFLASLCTEALHELSNPGASGSIFFITNDDEFIIKTVEKKEADFLQKLLPGYYMNLNQNPRTLLPKFYGLYCYQQPGRNIRFVVMNNLLPSSIKMHEKYDLKGSTYKRKASKYELAKKTPTCKDLDFRERHAEGLLLECDTYDALMKTIRRDCRVLESFKIMDYSQLLAIHNIDEAKKAKASQSNTQAEAVTPPSDQPSTSQGATASLATPGPISRGRSTKQRLANFSTALESIQADVDPVELEDEDVPPGGIPARNCKGERLLLFIGIIDILQSYRLKKKLEHGFKSIVHDGDSISVHRPSFYAQRFQAFFERDVFKKIASPIRSPSKKKSTARTRSVTEQGNENSTDLGGGLLHRSKPDLIPQASDHKSSRPTSSHMIDPKWSGSTVNSSLMTSSSLSTTTSAWSGLTTPGPPAYQSIESHGYLTIVQENPSNTTLSTRVHAIPQSEELLPPYSEKLPDGVDITQPPSIHVQEVTTPTEAGSPGATAESSTNVVVQKSSFRRERGAQVEKREVRFSAEESTLDRESSTDNSSHAMVELSQKAQELSLTDDADRNNGASNEETVPILSEGALSTSQTVDSSHPGDGNTLAENDQQTHL